MNIDIRRLRHLLAAVEQGNIKKAAASQHITQSALTRSIQKLETDLGTKLLDRQSRGVTPTPVGKRLCEHAKRIVNAVDTASLDMRDLISGSGTQLRLGICPTLLSRGCLDGLMELSLARPMLDLYVVEAFYNTLLQLLRLGELDLVLTTLPEGNNVAGMFVEELCSVDVERSIFASRDHHLFQQRAISQNDLKNARWVVANQAYYIRGLETYFDVSRIPRPNVYLKADSLAVLRHAIVFHGHIALLSRVLVSRYFRAESVKPIPGTAQRFTISHGLVFSRDYVPSIAFQNVVEKIRAFYTGSEFSADDDRLLI